MKKLILFVLFLFSISSVYSQKNTQTDSIYDFRMSKELIHPKFPGAQGSFQKYVGYKIQSAITQPISLQVSFVVETDGSLSSVKFITYVKNPLRKAITDAILNSPRWIPGSIFGKPVRVSYTLPIIIK